VDTSLAVLWVGDSVPETRIVLRLLEQLGFTDVAHQRSALASLTLMRTRRFGLVLCDIDIAPMNGLQLLQAVRASRDLSNLCFVLVTGNTSPDAVFSGKRLGADAILLKPFTPMQLRSKLSALIKRNSCVWID
jgi:two-component system chemotaxis response regulator CheY